VQETQRRVHRQEKQKCLWQNATVGAERLEICSGMLRQNPTDEMQNSKTCGGMRQLKLEKQN